MTFSIAALDRKTGMFGIGVASSSIAVANRCPWARAGTGAVCTQHRTDIRCGPLGLDLLSQGFAAQEVVDILVAGSEYPAQRQFAVVDREGRTAFFNGPGIESIATGAVGDACVSVPLGLGFHSRRLRLISSQVGQVAPSHRPRWTHRRRLEKALLLLADDRLDFLITEEVPFEHLPNALPRLLASGAPGLATAVRYG